MFKKKYPLLQHSIKNVALLKVKNRIVVITLINYVLILIILELKSTTIKNY